MKLTLDVETVCLTCEMFFTIHDFLRNLKLTKENIKSGYHISGLSCPNCGLNDLDFDFIVAEQVYDTKTIINFRKMEHKRRK